LGEVLAGVDESTTVVVMAGHGMTSKYQTQFMLANILLKLGVAERDLSTSVGPIPWSAKRVLDPTLTWGWQHTPEVVRRWLEPLRHRTRELVQTPSRNTKIPLDPAAGKCFILENNSTHGGIRVNLVGREPAGKIRPGAEYE